jgi:hypothetical protein
MEGYPCYEIHWGGLLPGHGGVAKDAPYSSQRHPLVLERRLLFQSAILESLEI